MLKLDYLFFIHPVYSCYQIYSLDVPKLFMSFDIKHIGSTVLHALESQFSKFQNFSTCPFYTKVPFQAGPPSFFMLPTTM